MNEKTIFIILIIVTVGLASVTGVLAWDNMQTKENNIHKIDISNVTANDPIDNTDVSSDSKEEDLRDEDYSYDEDYDYYDDDPYAELRDDPEWTYDP